MGKLQGINLSTEIRSILDTALDLPQPAISNNDSLKSLKKNDKIDNASGRSSVPASSSLSSSPRSMSASSPSVLMEQVQKAKRSLSQLPLDANEAKSILEAAIQSTNNADSASRTTATKVLPLAGAQAIKFLITNSQSQPNEKAKLLQQLESALRQTTLYFTPAPTTKTIDPQYEKRRARLLLQDEERSYLNLTTNLKTAASLKDDNITAKSMMYATSVGLNMVVAPITFGVFMFFFAGSIFSRFFDSTNDDDNNNRIRAGDTIDIRSVIAGVISGVFMLFVEMILFVIRSHELDAAVRKKSRRKENRANAFGYTTKNMARVYVRDD